MVCDTVMADTRHSTFVQTQRTHGVKSEPCVDCGLWLTTMCDSGFTNCHQHVPPMQDTDDDRSCVHACREGTCGDPNFHLIFL
jgi:hypothetical protein